MMKEYDFQLDTGGAHLSGCGFMTNADGSIIPAPLCHEQYERMVRKQLQTRVQEEMHKMDLHYKKASDDHKRVLMGLIQCVRPHVLMAHLYALHSRTLKFVFPSIGAAKFTLEKFIEASSRLFNVVETYNDLTRYLFFDPSDSINDKQMKLIFTIQTCETESIGASSIYNVDSFVHYIATKNGMDKHKFWCCKGSDTEQISLLTSTCPSCGGLQAFKNHIYNTDGVCFKSALREQLETQERILCSCVPPAFVLPLPVAKGMHEELDGTSTRLMM